MIKLLLDKQIFASDARFCNNMRNDGYTILALTWFCHLKSLGSMPKNHLPSNNETFFCSHDGQDENEKQVIYLK